VLFVVNMVRKFYFGLLAFVSSSGGSLQLLTGPAAPRD